MRRKLAIRLLLINNNQNRTTMKAMNDNTGTPMAKGLNVLLIIAMGIMAIAILFLLSFSLLLMTNNVISAEFLKELAQTNKDIGLGNPIMAVFGAGIIAAMWFYVLNILRKIVSTLLDGNPFISDNISRLRTMWIIIALSEVVRIILVNLSSAGEMVIDLRAGTIFLVFVIAALSEVFRHGAELRRDAELTI